MTKIKHIQFSDYSFCCSFVGIFVGIFKFKKKNVQSLNVVLMAKIKHIQFSDLSFCCSFAPCLVFVPLVGQGSLFFKKWSFSYKFTFEVLWKKGKGKSFFEGKKLILFSDMGKGKRPIIFWGEKVNSIFFLVAEGHKLCGREPEVEFVTHVTHGGSVKFLPVV